MQKYNSKTKQFEEVPVTNERKPHRLLAGYVAELKNRITGIGHVVIYLAKEQGLDVSGGKYAVVCETHKSIYQTTSLPLARTAMKSPDFCEECVETGFKANYIDPNPSVGHSIDVNGNCNMGCC